MEDRIKNVMAAVFEISADDITDESSPDTIESWDSLKHMNLILVLEEEFNIELTEEQTVEILSYPLIKIVLKELGIH